MKNLCTGLLLTVCALLFTMSPATAAWVDLGGDQGVTVTVLESTPQRIALEYKVGGFEQHDLVIDGKTYSMISLPGEAERLDRGLPELPLVARSVIIPEDRRMDLRVTALEYTDLQGITPIPSKGSLLRTVDPAQVPFTFDAYLLRQRLVSRAGRDPARAVHPARLPGHHRGGYPDPVPAVHQHAARRDPHGG